MAILFKTLHHMLLHVGSREVNIEDLMTCYVSYTLYLASSRRRADER